MPGQVVEDSIIGNKERTKQYWEVRLQKEQDEKDKKKGSLSSNSVIQKMNAEIEELHRREKELKRNNAKTSDEDEDEDIFSSTGSSVDEFEPSESPRLESGFYSNAGEDDVTINSPELSKNKKATIEITLQQESLKNGEELEPPKSPNKTPVITEDNGTAEVDATYSFHIANYRKETPIEREIRMAREREQEYKLRRSSIMSTDSQQAALPPPATPAVVATSPAATSTPEPFKPVSFISTRNMFESREKANKDAQGKDLQYVMATDRLKKEILEAKMREEELKARTQPNATLETNTFADTNGSKSSSVSDISKQEEVETPKFQVQEEVTAVHATPVVRQVEPAIVRQASAEVAPVSPQNVKSPITPVTPSTYQTFSFLAKNPKFNTLERKYLLKPSMQLRIGTNFQIPKAEESEAVAKVDEKVEPEPEPEEPENDEPVVPRRRLISTQQRIAAEMREMREREKELELVRKYRSTSDLTINDDVAPNAPSQHSEDDVFSENGGSVTEEIPEPEFPIMARSALGNTISFGPPGKARSALGNTISFGGPGAGKARKKSNLVSQWEEKMQGGTDKA